MSASALSRPLPGAVLVAGLAVLLAGCGPVASDPDPGPPGSETTAPAAPVARPSASPDVVVHRTEVPPLHPSVDGYGETTVEITTSDGARHRIAVKVADTDAERRHGLMEVAHLPEGTGMLFEMERERTSGFWMFRTLVPLSIAYIEEDGRIGDIVAMEPCDDPSGADCPTYPPRDGVRYVRALEVPQGWFAEHGVTVGDRVTIHAGAD